MKRTHQVYAKAAFSSAAFSVEVSQDFLVIQGFCWNDQKRVILNDVSFSVPVGSIFGILGPNGSGKSTLLQCLTGQKDPHLGSLWLEGRLQKRQAASFKKSTGVVFQSKSLDPYLTVLENLQLAAALYGLHHQEAKDRSYDLLNYMQLSDRAHMLVKKLSGGLQRRLELARALIHRPRLLILDEPTQGLDRMMFEKIWQLLAGLKRAYQLTILLTSHRPEEADRCDRLMLLDRGSVLAIDTPLKLMQRLEGDRLMIQPKEGFSREALAKLLEKRLQLALEIRGYTLVLSHSRGHAMVPHVMALLQLPWQEDEKDFHVLKRLSPQNPAGLIQSVAMRQVNVEDVFFQLTGRQLLQEQQDGVARGAWHDPQSLLAYAGSQKS